MRVVVVLDTTDGLTGYCLLPDIGGPLTERCLQLQRCTNPISRAMPIHSSPLLMISSGDTTQPIAMTGPTRAGRIIDALFVVRPDDIAQLREHPADSSGSEPPMRNNRRREGLDL